MSSAVDDFVKRVDKTLNCIFSCGTKIKEFCVKCPYLLHHRSNVDEWVRFAAMNETHKFELDFEPWDDGSCFIGSEYDLPEKLYTNGTTYHFRELRFNNCNFVIWEKVSWDFLKKLTLEYDGGFSDEALEYIVASAPALEFLDLQLCEGISKLHFGRNSVLKELILHIQDWYFLHKEEASFEISAPSVETLKVSGRFRSCKLVDMISLVEATLFGLHVDRDSDYPVLTREVVSSLLNVKTLTVGTWVIQGIAVLLTDDGRPLFPKCKCLTVDTHLWKEDPGAIARLLESTPQVETLIVTISDIKVKVLHDNPSGHGNFNVDQYWTSLETAFNYLTSLRKVKFIGFWASRTVAFPFVQFVLKNARGLHEVVIDLGVKVILHEIAPTEVDGTFQKLLSYPRSSPDAKLLIYP